MDEWDVQGVEQFISLLNPGSLVLDVGCGPGIASQKMTGAGMNVMGIDISEKMIELAKQEAPRGKFFVLDLKDDEKIEEKFDGVFAKAVLLHIPKNEAPKTVALWANKLKNGGCLYVAVKKIKPEQREEEVKEEDDYGYKYKRFFSYYTPKEVKTMVQRAGLNIVFDNTANDMETKWIQIIARK